MLLQQNIWGNHLMQRKGLRGLRGSSLKPGLSLRPLARVPVVVTGSMCWDKLSTSQEAEKEEELGSYCPFRDVPPVTGPKCLSSSAPMGTTRSHTLGFCGHAHQSHCSWRRVLGSAAHRSCCCCCGVQGGVTVTPAWESLLGSRSV